MSLRIVGIEARVNGAIGVATEMMNFSSPNGKCTCGVVHALEHITTTLLNAYGNRVLDCYDCTIEKHDQYSSL